MRSNATVFDEIADQTGDIFLRLSPKGVFRFVSGSVRTIGHEPAALVGASCFDFVHPDDLATLIENRKAILRGERLSSDGRVHRFRTGDGQWAWVEGNPRVVRDARGRVREVVNVLRNVTERRQADLEAAAQAEIFRSAFQHSGVGKALVGLDGNFIDINTTFCELIGYPKPVMLKLDFRTITHPEDLNADLGLLEQLNRGEIPRYSMDKRYLRADGTVVWVHLTVSMVRDNRGLPKLYVAQVQDRTQQRAAEEALAANEARFRLLAENANDLVMKSNPDGTLAYMSPSSLSLTGYAADEVIGQTALRWIHPDDRTLVISAFQDQVNGGGLAPPRIIEYRVRTRDGRDIWIESSPRANVDPATGEVDSVTDSGRNVTARKALETRLSEARDAAEAAARVKADFMANMSHEIRTPLTAILGFAALLSARNDLPQEARQQIARVSSGGQALLALVNDVLDFSKLEAGEMPIKPRPASLGETIDEALALFEPQAASKGIDLVLASGADLGQAMIDPDRLRQVLLNLVGNAVKFTDAGSVTVRAAHDAMSERLRIEVTDTGPGMDQDQVSRLFQRFSQVDASAARRHGGTGLGLAICRGLVDAMGGDIGVSSTPGTGSTFWFEINAPAAEAVVTRAADAVVDLAGVRLLVADDNPVNRELVRVLLSHFEVDVTEAADGLEAVERADREAFDILLMDLRMPGLDGADAALKIRGRAGPNQTAPILAFTADFDLERYGEQAGRAFDGVVRKPIDAVELVSAIAGRLAAGEGSRPAERRQA